MVGGCDDGAARGGKERDVGWTSERTGSTSAGRKDVLEGGGGGVCNPTSMLMSAVSSSTSTQPVKTIKRGRGKVFTFIILFFSSRRVWFRVGKYRRGTRQNL